MSYSSSSSDSSSDYNNNNYNSTRASPTRLPSQQSSLSSMNFVKIDRNGSEEEGRRGTGRSGFGESDDDESKRKRKKKEEDVKKFIDRCGYMYPDESKISKNLICIICSEPWSDPVITNQCGHVFCSGCIKTWLRHVCSCPNDRRMLTDQGISGAPRILKDLVNELSVICSLGCGWEGRRDDFENHLEFNCNESDRLNDLISSPSISNLIISSKDNQNRNDDEDEEDDDDEEGKGKFKSFRKEERTFKERWKKLAFEVHSLKKENKEQSEVIEKWKDKVSKLQLQLQQVAESSSSSTINSESSFNYPTPSPGGNREVNHPANCDFCKTEIRGIRYKCLKCPDLDSCSSCFKFVNQNHPIHDFVPIRSPNEVNVICLPEWKIVHPNINCNNCQRSVVGPRFKCVICSDYDLCHHCMALPRSPHPIGHPMTRFINPTQNQWY